MSCDHASDHRYVTNADYCAITDESTDHLVCCADDLQILVCGGVMRGWVVVQYGVTMIVFRHYVIP